MSNENNTNAKFCNFMQSSYYIAREDWNNFMVANKDRIEKDFISKSCDLSFGYAKTAGRFELGEEAISKDAEKSYLYSRDVLGYRFESGENTIAKTPKFAYVYARDVIKNRWPEAEDSILNSSSSNSISTIVSYASEVIRGAWPEAEELIKGSRNSHIIFEYCVGARKNRWQEVEDILLGAGEDKIIAYAEKSVGGRWIEGEKKLLETKKVNSKIEYCKKILKGRWKEFEEILFQKENAECLFNYAKYIVGGKLPEILHNKMIVLAMTRKDDKFVKKYFKAKKYKVEKEKLALYCTNEESV